MKGEGEGLSFVQSVGQRKKRKNTLICQAGAMTIHWGRGHSEAGQTQEEVH